MFRSTCLLFLLATTVAKGQQPWVFTHGQPGRDALVSDMIWTNNGLVLTCYYADPPFHPPYSGSLIRISSSGSFIDERSLGSTLNHSAPSVVLSGPDQRLHVLGAYSEFPDSLSGFFHYGCSVDGSLEDSSFNIAANARRTLLENATFLDDGSIILGGSLSYEVNGSIKYAQLLKLNNDGQVITDNTFGMSGMHIQYTRDVVPFSDGVLVSFDEWPQPPGLYGRFSSNLDFDAQWYGQAPHYNPLNPLDSIVKGAMTLRPLNDRKYIVGGAFKIPNDQYSSAVYVMDTSGATLKAFVPHSPYYHDHSALQSTIASIDTNTFYFLSWGNISFWGDWIPYEPIEPDVLHVYKMDNDLNVLCDFLLDGFEDSTYYIPVRIKTTPDGGFAIIGGKKDMTDPTSNIVAWVQTFSPNDCTVGIETQEDSRSALVFPNPGSSGFDVLLNGQGLTAGQIVVIDTRGVQVAEGWMEGTTGRVDCSDLPDGLYLYRILDRNGHPYASGRWVKQ
jgi:hypothetical protein